MSKLIIPGFIYLEWDPVAGAGIAVGLAEVARPLEVLCLLMVERPVAADEREEAYDFSGRQDVKAIDRESDDAPACRLSVK